MAHSFISVISDQDTHTILEKKKKVLLTSIYVPQVVELCCSVWNEQMWGQGIDLQKEHWEDSEKWERRICRSCSHAASKKYSEVENRSRIYYGREEVLRVTDLCSIYVIDHFLLENLLSCGFSGTILCWHSSLPCLLRSLGFCKWASLPIPAPRDWCSLGSCLWYFLPALLYSLLYISSYEFNYHFYPITSKFLLCYSSWVLDQSIQHLWDSSTQGTSNTTYSKILYLSFSLTATIVLSDVCFYMGATIIPLIVQTRVLRENQCNSSVPEISHSRDKVMVMLCPIYLGKLLLFP